MTRNPTLDGTDWRPLRARMGATKNYAEMERVIIAAVDDMNHDHLPI
jgi:hypothetical protein